MKKIRINELARELEVKPGVILDLLPELGVQEKKTHSSSIDEDVALELRHRLHINGVPEGGSLNGDSDHHDSLDEAHHEDESAVRHAGEDDHPQHAPADPFEKTVRVEKTVREEAGSHGEPQPMAAFHGERRAGERAETPIFGQSAPPTTATPPPPVAEPEADSPVEAKQAAGPGTPAETPGQPSRKSFQPLRPPLFGGGSTAQQAPSSAPPAGQTVPGNRLAPGTVISRPAAAPPLRPGMTPTGPRQPLPPEQTRSPISIPRPSAPPPRVTAPGIATPSPAPARPAAPPARPAASAPAAPAARPTPSPSAQPPAPPRPAYATTPPPTHVVLPAGPTPGSPPVAARPGAPGPRPPQPPPNRPAAPTLTPGAPIAPPRPPGARAPLAGQPIARPVVPPRPDLVARLQQQSRPPAPAPGAPRPGAPARPTTLTPGRPIFPQSNRPGLPQARGPMPGAPGVGYGPQRRRPGATHPTTPLRPEPATPLPGEQQRRHQIKPGAKQVARKREQEGNLRERVAKRSAVEEPPPIDREITVSEGITVKELSEKLGVKANLVIKRLVDKNIFANINQTLDVKLAEEIARAFGASTNQVSYEEESTQEVELAEDPKALVRRAPVVTVMGHVDHGKTSLLDAIRQTNVAGREAGGITQHIGAYRIEKNGRKIVFIDTPGHQAFTRMRARGAKVTDIVVLVVAADDGVMPQTLEAIDHAKAAGVPVVVAINKIDKPDAQPERIKQQLADRGLLAEDWGGDVVMTPVSAKTGQNLDLLLEMVLLVADIQDLKANPARPAVGTVLEAQLDRGRGPVATVLVRNGTLRVGDFFICGALFSKVRAMFDDRGTPVREAEPSMPVEVIGLDDLPEVGDNLQVVSDTSKAKQIVIYREAKARDVAMAKGARVATLDSLHKQFQEGDLKDLNLIIKADVGGTAEVLSDNLQQLSTDKIRVRVLHAGVGAINESDVLLASASEAIIIGFNVKPERNATALAEQQKVDIRQHSVIYQLADEIRLAMTGLLDPVFREVVQGHAEVKQTFRISKVGTVAGCYVQDGYIRRDCQIRVVRGGEVVHTGKIEALKRFKNDASEVKNGLECGISLVNFNNVQEGDMFEAFVMERVAVEVPA